MARAHRGEARSVPRAARGRSQENNAARVALRIEKVAHIWRELDVLARLEHGEMEAGFRHFDPDWESIMASEAQGTIKCLVARRGPDLVGYLGWSIGFDLEARGALIVHQLSWYVLPGQYAVAVRMLDWLIEECRRLGVQFLYLSHPERGRGKTLGRFFEKRGAVHTSNHYTLKLKDI